MQYGALARVDGPNGVARVLERDRDAELTSYAHGAFARFGLSLARLASLGAYKHTEDAEDPVAALDANRRVAYHARILQAALENEAPLDAAWSAPAIRASVAELAQLGAKTRKKVYVAGLLERVMDRAQDEEVRDACVLALKHLRHVDSAVVVAETTKPECAACRGSVAAATPLAARPLTGPVVLGAAH
jgi:hypothetical protein